MILVINMNSNHDHYEDRDDDLHMDCFMTVHRCHLVWLQDYDVDLLVDHHQSLLLLFTNEQLVKHQGCHHVHTVIHHFCHHHDHQRHDLASKENIITNPI